MAGRALTAAEVLRAWELGAPLHPVDRALLLCAFGMEAPERAALAALSLGERDAILLELRRATFGARLEAVVECERCQTALEVAVDVAALAVAAPAAEARVVVAGRQLALRKLDSYDLAAIVGLDAERARRILVERSLDGDVGALSDADCAVVAERLGELDPQADLVFELICAECQHRFVAPFDPGDYLWNEISVEARRLMQEVATLARAFRWSEADILSMSRKRRQHYLELADA